MCPKKNNFCCTQFPPVEDNVFRDQGIWGCLSWSSFAALRGWGS